MVAPFRFDRSWTFAVPPDELWSVLARTEDYRVWWSWLRAFDAPGLAVGTPARCIVRAPLPYSLTFTVTPTDVQEARLVEAFVDGDLRGTARLELEPDGTGTRARLVWSIELRHGLLAAGARFARPLLEWGHEWVVRSGVEQFERRALATVDS